MKSLQVLFLSIITFAVFAQPSPPCTPADNVVAQVSNVICVSGDHLEFELTVTENGIPLTTNSGYSISPIAGGPSLFSDVAFGGVTFDNFPIVLDNATGCPDVTTLYFSSGDGSLPCDPALSLAPSIVPTLSEWGLIILGFFLLIIGALVIKRNLAPTSRFDQPAG